HLAETVAETITRVDADGTVALYRQGQRLQQYIADLHRTLRRDIEVLDDKLRILADAIPQNRGSPFEGTGEREIEAVLVNGRSPTFVERSPDFPAAAEQVVVPLRVGSTLVGAVVMEYTAIHRELLAAGRTSRWAVLVISFLGLAAALIVAVASSRRIVRNLRQLTETAGRLGEGDGAARATIQDSGELGELAAVLNRMADRIAAQRAELITMATTDPLTGLGNRRSFQDGLTAAVEHGATFALLIVDLDHFKAINDR